MNNAIIQKCAVFITCIFLPFSSFLYSQSSVLGSMGEISEIIIPSTSKVQNNDNIYYEVHLMDRDYPSPSFWYKIIFKEACHFEFTLFPIVDDDGYDFYFFRVADNMDFCDAIQENKLISCNDARIYKQYTGAEKADNFRSKLVNIKALPVEANDAIYIEVFSTIGNNCGHVLDFRTTSSSFVMKVVNDKCRDFKSNVGINEGKYKPVFTEKEAIRIFKNTVCHLEDNPVLITSIKAEEEKVTIKKELDFNKYDKKVIAKKASIKKDTVPLSPILDSPSANSTKTDSIKINDTSIDSTKIAAKTDPPIVVQQVKSTSDLNDKEDVWAPIKRDIVNINSKREKNSTRLDVDYVLFSLLKEDLKRKMQSNRNQQKNYNAVYRKTSDKTNRANIKLDIAELREQKLELLAKYKDTREKLKQIQKLKSENKKNGVKSTGSVFTSSVYQEEQQKPTGGQTDSSGPFIENPTLPLGIIYKVQIGVYKNKISADIFKGLSPVSSESYPSGIKYYVGAFRHYTDARNAKEYIRTMGLTDAFIVAYNNGKRVVVQDARLHEND